MPPTVGILKGDAHVTRPRARRFFFVRTGQKRVARAVSVAPTAGERLTRELSRDSDPYELRLLITQAARHADRLESIHNVLTGDRKSWMRITSQLGDAIEVHVDDLVKEERQQTTVLRHLLAEIHRQRAGIPMGDDDDDDATDV
jgi:hypothetical protein